ncbi:MAG: hypothetical protein CL678_03065 [Bdellovibrionaceae bacterium]|nr:hypothetical protein [Pseudobdellovibrionaceae bacterium]|tara:strand:- start:224 stop:484 length:261 start_codon:yes stop_codon:yes gene_type:complete
MLTKRNNISSTRREARSDIFNALFYLLQGNTMNLNFIQKTSFIKKLTHIVQERIKKLLPHCVINSSSINRGENYAQIPIGLLSNGS